MTIKRSEVKKEDKWNVEAIFANDALWDDEFKTLKNDIKKIVDFKGTLKDSSNAIKNTIDFDVNISRRLDMLYTYAHLKHDEDTKDEKYKSAHDSAYSLFIEYGELSSWFTPELLNIDDKVIDAYINSDELKEYKFYLERILRAKQHTLNENEEKLLSMSQNAFATGDVFRALNDGDLKFGFITDAQNNQLELTHSKYYTYLINKDRSVREKAFKSYHNKFDEYPMTMAGLLQICYGNF
jgi:oligoendopeptidase F